LQPVIYTPMLRGSQPPWDADGGQGVQIWKVAANILNKQSRTANKVWSPSLVAGRMP